jgi:hypothetical protein
VLGDAVDVEVEVDAEVEVALLSLVLAVDSPLVAAGAEAVVDVAPESLAAGALWPPRKSVTYQPLPFN